LMDAAQPGNTEQGCSRAAAPAHLAGAPAAPV
jgi:hypothetical protein